MPFGEKKDVNGQIIDFDKIYQYIIKQAVEEVGVQCVRCDEIAESGWIHADMFEKLLEADVSIVDITSLNANVFYELGIRHALKNSVTVLIRQKGTHAPFNIQGLRVIDYDPTDLASVDKSKTQIGNFIQNGLRYKLTDSPVYQVLENRVRIERTPEPILKTETFAFSSPSMSKRCIGLITGDIQDVRSVDVWVNSENSNMQMDRYYERSISSIIRYLGAKKDDAGCVIDDTIAEELKLKMREREFVPPAHVISTSSGALTETHNVKRIFHVASVIGAIGQGYRPIQHLNRCVTNALYKIEEYPEESLKSILFPLMGTGKGRGNLQSNSSLLINSAVAYLQNSSNKIIEEVYFLTYTQEELDVCRNLILNTHKLKPVI